MFGGPVGFVRPRNLLCVTVIRQKDFVLCLVHQALDEMRDVWWPGRVTRNGYPTNPLPLFRSRLSRDASIAVAPDRDHLAHV